METNNEPTTAQELGIQVGDFFSAGWGYDQTNIDFHQVVGISKSGKSVRLAQCETVIHEVMENGGTHDRVFPGDIVGEPITRRLNIWKDSRWNAETGEREEFWTAITRTADWAGAPCPRWCGAGVFPTSLQTNSAFGH